MSTGRTQVGLFFSLFFSHSLSRGGVDLAFLHILRDFLHLRAAEMPPRSRDSPQVEVGEAFSLMKGLGNEEEESREGRGKEGRKKGEKRV